MRENWRPMFSKRLSEFRCDPGLRQFVGMVHFGTVGTVVREENDQRVLPLAVSLR